MTNDQDGDREQDQPLEMIVERSLQTAGNTGRLLLRIAISARIGSAELQIDRYGHDDELCDLQERCVTKYLEFNGMAMSFPVAWTGFEY